MRAGSTVSYQLTLAIACQCVISELSTGAGEVRGKKEYSTELLSISARVGGSVCCIIYGFIINAHGMLRHNNVHTTTPLRVVRMRKTITAVDGE